MMLERSMFSNMPVFVIPLIQSILIFLALTFLYRIIFHRKTKLLWLNCLVSRTRFISYFAIFLFSSFWFIYNWASYSEHANIFRIATFILIAIISILIIESLSAFIYDYYLIQKKKALIPVIFRDMVRITIYFIFFLFYIGSILKINLLPLLTTSAILSIIIGLALQDTLGNLFSGLVLHMSKPFSLGDWIRVGNYEGKVDKIDWRATSLLTFSGDYVVIPNSIMSKGDLLNFSSPTIDHSTGVSVSVHYKHPPNYVINTLIKIALNDNNVLKDPEPTVFVTDFSDFSINYSLFFWINDYSIHRRIESNIRKQIWYNFKRDDITIPYPIRDIYSQPVINKANILQQNKELLRSIDFFRPFSQNDIDILVHRIKEEIYPANDMLFSKGDSGDKFFVIRSGSVEIYIENDKKEKIFKNILSNGNFFGEISLLTGESRSASARTLTDCEMITLNKQDLKDIIKNNQQLEKCISKAIVERQMKTSGLKTDDYSNTQQEIITKNENQLFEKIRTFFSY